MKLNTLFLFAFLSILQGLKLTAQVNHYPVRIEEKVETFKEMSSKHGFHIQKKSKIVVVYNDSVEEVVTHHSMKKLLATVPEAQMEWKKYNSNRVYEASSIPLFAFGFWGAYNLSKGEHLSRNTLFSILGLAGGYAVLEHFDWQKKRNLKRMMVICNNYWSHKEEKQIEDVFKPDMIRLGVLNQNIIGIGVSWQISE